MPFSLSSSGGGGGGGGGGGNLGSKKRGDGSKLSSCVQRSGDQFHAACPTVGGEGQDDLACTFESSHHEAAAATRNLTSHKSDCKVSAQRAFNRAAEAQELFDQTNVKLEATYEPLVKFYTHQSNPPGCAKFQFVISPEADLAFCGKNWSPPWLKDESKLKKVSTAVMYA